MKLRTGFILFIFSTILSYVSFVDAQENQYELKLGLESYDGEVEPRLEFEAYNISDIGLTVKVELEGEEQELEAYFGGEYESGYTVRGYIYEAERNEYLKTDFAHSFRLFDYKKASYLGDQDIFKLAAGLLGPGVYRDQFDLEEDSDSSGWLLGGLQAEAGVELIEGVELSVRGKRSYKQEEGRGKTAREDKISIGLGFELLGKESELRWQEVERDLGVSGEKASHNAVLLEMTVLEW